MIKADDAGAAEDLPLESESGAGGRLHRLRGYRFGLTLSLLIAAFILVVLWRDILVSKYPGEQGVYWSRFFGGTSDIVLGEGTHLKFPWDEIFIYSTRVMMSTKKTVLLTKDGMEINVEWAVRYQVDPTRLPELHRVLGPDYAERVVVPEVISALRQVIGNYSADQIYAKAEIDLIEEIEDRVKSRIEMFHPILFETVLLLRLDLPSEMQKGIVEKLLYEQRLLSYNFRVRAEEQEKKRKLIEAEGIRDFEATSKISMLKWRGIDATMELAKSPNAKIIMMGSGQNNLPLLLNGDSSAPLVAPQKASPVGKAQ